MKNKNRNLEVMMQFKQKKKKKNIERKRERKKVCNREREWRGREVERKGGSQRLIERKREI